MLRVGISNEYISSWASWNAPSCSAESPDINKYFKYVTQLTEITLMFSNIIKIKRTKFLNRDLTQVLTFEERCWTGNRDSQREVFCRWGRAAAPAGRCWGKPRRKCVRMGYPKVSRKVVSKCNKWDPRQFPQHSHRREARVRHGSGRRFGTHWCRRYCPRCRPRPHFHSCHHSRNAGLSPLWHHLTLLPHPTCN